MSFNYIKYQFIGAVFINFIHAKISNAFIIICEFLCNGYFEIYYLYQNQVKSRFSPGRNIVLFKGIINVLI